MGTEAAARLSLERRTNVFTKSVYVVAAGQRVGGSILDSSIVHMKVSLGKLLSSKYLPVVVVGVYVCLHSF